jgi:hypothetical protein
MKWPKSLRDLYKQYFSVEEEEQQAHEDDAKQLEFGYVIIAILLYLLIFLLLQAGILTALF